MKFRIIDQHVPGTVHGLDRIFLFIHMKIIHVLAVISRMPALFPKLSLKNIGRLHKLISVFQMFFTDIIFYDLSQHRPLGMIKNQPSTGLLMIDLKQLHLSSKFAVVPFSASCSMFR